MTAVTITTRPRKDGGTSYRCLWRKERLGGPTSWTTTSQREAKAFVKHARVAGVDEALRVWAERDNAGNDMPTVREAWDHYLENLTRPKDGTKDKYRRRVEVNGSWLLMLQDYPVSAVTREDVIRWVKARSSQVYVTGKGENEKRRTISPKTVRNDGALLSALMSDCVKRGLIAASPCEHVTYPKAYREGEMVVLTTEEFNRFVAALPPWWREFAWVLASTGLRINEATALRWMDIDFPGALLSVQHGWHKVEGGWKLETPKTPRSRRRIDLDERTIARLKAVRKRAEAKAKEKGWDIGPEAFVFTGPLGGVVRDNPLREDVWHPARERAGLRHFTPHDMRHLHASWMLAAGAAMEDVSERLGHETPQLTYSTYSHLTVGRRQRMVAGLTAAMAAVDDPSSGQRALPPGILDGDSGAGE